MKALLLSGEAKEISTVLKSMKNEKSAPVTDAAPENHGQELKVDVTGLAECLLRQPE